MKGFGGCEFLLDGITYQYKHALRIWFRENLSLLNQEFLGIFPTFLRIFFVASYLC